MFGQPGKGNIRLLWLTFVICMAGGQFGYDSGVVGAAITFDSFKNSFEIPADQMTKVSSIAVGVQQAGAFVGSFAVWPITKPFGRKIAIIVCSLVFNVGVLLEIVPTKSIDAFYVGRVIAGLGLGGASTMVPIYLSEMTPKEHRGRLGSCYQLMFTVGILASYWISYGCGFMKPQAAQWQIPISLQIVPAAILGLGMLTLKESTRWLAGKDRNEESWESLLWIRGGEVNPDIEAEHAEIIQGIMDERHAMEGFKLKELLEGPNFKRLAIGFTMFVCQQSTGATALAYFGPQFFALLVGEGDNNLLLTGIFGAIKFIACLFFVLVVSERFGRRTLLLSGSVFMSACMITTAAVVATHTPPGNGTITSAGIATVALIYMNIMMYNASWGPLPWPCVSEIFPTRIREPGIATSVGAQWLLNFVYSFSTPYMMDSWDWGTFLFYGILDLLCGAFAWFIVKETRNKTLEEIDTMYDPGSSDGKVSIEYNERECEVDNNNKNSPPIGK